MTYLKNYLFALIIFLSIFICSCTKEEKNEQKDENSLTSTLEISENQNFLEFETYLNATFVNNPCFVSVPLMQSFSFVHENGFISMAEQTRITNIVSGFCNDGALPRVIDVNLRDNKIEMMLDGNVFYQIVFPENIRPDGGMLGNGAMVSGTWCDETTDLGGGGCGRVARAYINSLSRPDNLKYWKNIKEFGIIGSCEFSVIDDWAFGGILEISSPELWHYNANCPNEPLCLSSTDLYNYLNKTGNLVDQYLPNGYQVIGFFRAYYDFQPALPPNVPHYIWNFYMKVGIPVIGTNGN